MSGYYDIGKAYSLGYIRAMQDVISYIRDMKKEKYVDDTALDVEEFAEVKIAEMEKQGEDK